MFYYNGIQKISGVWITSGSLQDKSGLRILSSTTSKLNNLSYLFWKIVMFKYILRAVEIEIPTLGSKLHLERYSRYRA